MMVRGSAAAWCAFLAFACCALPARGQLPPEKELATLRAAPEFEVGLFAAEPLITNPAAIDVDTHGRVWVAEIQWYRAGAKDPPADKIKVLEDTDGDGRADKVTVFADGVFAPMSICVAGQKIYVATSPDLWVYEDKNGDLVADGPPQKLLTGFGGTNHDHGAHSLVLGPDHKWWMSHGDEGCHVRGVDGSRADSRYGAVVRGELDGSKLETVASNFRNPYEVCVSSFGEAFLSDNDNDGNESVRICWILEGGNYGWFGGPPFHKQELAERLSPGTPFREHWHFRGHVPGFVPGTLVTGFGSPCGICYYEGAAFGSKYKNAPLHADCGPRECRVYRHVPAGFGMKATSEVFLSNQGDDYFRPDDICAAPDGRLYISDWYDGGVGGHAYNNPDQGRIFVLTPKGKPLARREKPGPYETVGDAIEGLKSPNLATRYLARERLLAEGEKSVPALRDLLADPEPNFRARALWVLDRIGGDARQPVIDELQSPEPAFRALAVRILRRHDDSYADAILAMADDPADEVRREVLLAIRNLSGEPAMAALARIAATYDGADRYQLEAINVAAGKRKEELLARLEKSGPSTDAQFALLQVLSPARATDRVLARLNDGQVDDKAAERLLETTLNIPSLDAGRGLVKLALDASNPVVRRQAALRNLAFNAREERPWAALRGDKEFLDALLRLLADEAMREAALDTIDKLRLTKLGDAVLTLARDSRLDGGLRARAVAASTVLKPRQLVEGLRSLLDDGDPRVSSAARHGLTELADLQTVRAILRGERFSREIKTQTASELIDDSSGALVLLRLIHENELDDEIKQTVLAKAAAHPDANVRALYEEFIPPEKRPRKLGAAVSADEVLALPGDANRGRMIFFKSSAAQCKQCHEVQGFGGTSGPDLSHIGKKYERAALLETILEPSKAIAPEYAAYLLETKSGQVLAGFLVERNSEGVVLRDVKDKVWRVAADEVEALVPQQKSLMPELILSEVTAQDAADLLAFLAGLK